MLRGDRRARDAVAAGEGLRCNFCLSPSLSSLESKALGGLCRGHRGHGPPPKVSSTRGLPGPERPEVGRSRAVTSSA